MRQRAVLEVNRMRLGLHLGAGEEERSLLQEVKVSIKFFLSTPPAACQSDRLDDSICYGKLVEELQNRFAGSEFRLIEHLGFSIYETIRAGTPSEIGLWVKVEKPDTPLADILGSACFIYTDTHNGELYGEHLSGT